MSELERYCKVTSMEWLLTMAYQFAISHEESELGVVCDEIERRNKHDAVLTAKAIHELNSKERKGVQEADETESGTQTKGRSRR